MNGASNVAEHAAAGPGLMRKSILGRIALAVAAFMVFRVAFEFSGLSNPARWAIWATIVFEVAPFFLRRKYRKWRSQKGFEQHKEAEKGRQSDFDTRYAQAKANGDFDRFNKEVDS